MLETIVADTVLALMRRKRLRPLPVLEKGIAGLPPTRDFRGALAAEKRAVIAEVKRSSPSAGRIVEHFDPAAIARDYETGGACAVSVLTEGPHFEGCLSYLERVKKAVSIPVLRKDFVIDPYQVYETRISGGDAVLLIAGLLGQGMLGELLRLAWSLGLEALVEVHTEADLAIALQVDAAVIGINNRDLKTFVTDLGVSERLAPCIPPEKRVVSESGIRTGEDIDRLERAGIGAFLVGESLVCAKDRAAAVRSMRRAGAAS